LIEARVGRDRASFALPPSLGHLGAGDVVKLAEPGGLASYRIDQFEQGDQGLAQAVRVDETLYESSQAMSCHMRHISLQPRSLGPGL
jgi:hypothetical protein